MVCRNEVQVHKQPTRPNTNTKEKKKEDRRRHVSPPSRSQKYCERAYIIIASKKPEG
jgi:hypothetical protein